MKLYKAIVENNNSPKKDGKVQVRIYGIHTEQNENSKDPFNYIDTKDLPYADIIHSPESMLINGIGTSNVIHNGTTVWVILENEDVNRPLILGVFSGLTTVDSSKFYKTGKGFSDPLEEFPITARLNEEDINRLARVEKLNETIHNTINTNKTTVSKTDSTSGADVSMTEPLSTNDASIYPHVQVKETKSGHVIELDDTISNERIRIYHKSGSYVEFKPDGSLITNIEGNDSYVLNKGNLNTLIEKSMKQYIKQNLDIIVDGYVKKAIGGTYSKHIQGKYTTTADADVNRITGAKLIETVQNTMTVSASTIFLN